MASTTLFTPAGATLVPAAAQTRPLPPSVPIMITGAATFYFGVLALINAHLLSTGYALVAGCELLILLTSVYAILFSGLNSRDVAPLTLLFTFVFLALYVSMLNDRIYVDALRNISVIAVFTMLGGRVQPERVIALASVTCAIVLVVLIIEAVSLPAYVTLFNPALFYGSVRGYQAQEWNESGLFGTALGFAGRWTFGVLSHRAGSIFLEQVSLGNYSSVLTVIVASSWRSMPARQRLLFCLTVIACLITTSARSATGFAVFTIAGYFLFPYLPRFGTLAIAPILLVLGFILTFFTGLTDGDDLSGRISVTVRTLQRADSSFWIGGRLDLAPRVFDTGFGYLLVSSTILGALAIWLYNSCVLNQSTTMEKRCAYSLAIYTFGNLMVSGNSIFSMKTAALLWLFVGSVMGRRADEGQSASLTKSYGFTAVTGFQTRVVLENVPASGSGG